MMFVKSDRKYELVKNEQSSERMIFKMGEYILERDGQIQFYNAFLPRVNPDLSVDDIISDYNDGVLNGNLLEFKLNISDLNTVLFQCIKYLSALRVKGKPIPANILIIDLNATTAYVYHSLQYVEYIEKLYSGGASKENSGFVGGTAISTLNYSVDDDTETLIRILKEKNYTKIHINEDCVVGWAKSFYQRVPTARKEDFIGDETGIHQKKGELRNPVYFKEYIYPYEGKTNVRFNYLMDKLNDYLLKKNLGAFYTPDLYAKKSVELVRKAIARVPEGNDYVIIDRCAGTGNLESNLTDEELQHCIVSTVEYYEYKVLQELLGSKVRNVIPPIENENTFNAGLVEGADALSEDYINNSVIRECLDNPKCTIILFENPPYTEPQARNTNTIASWKKSYVTEKMKEEIKENSWIKGQASNDLGNVFIWSAFRFYLRQPTDSYIVYSPVKYWKSQHLINKRLLDGFAFNRKHFHTNINACIMCALWSNEDSNARVISIKAFDIVKNSSGVSELRKCGTLKVKRIYKLYSQVYYEKRKPLKLEKNGICVGLDGKENTTAKRYIQPDFSDEYIGYMIANSSGFDTPDLSSSLVVTGCYKGHGFYIHKDNYLEKLPMFCASRYITYNRNWTERARIMKSADGARQYFCDIRDKKISQFLLKCLLFTCVETQNHMRTFTGSDNRFYRNELCLDDTNGETIATRDIQSLDMDDTEKKILSQWKIVMENAKQCDGYDPSLTYGVFQISTELDTSHKDNTTNATIRDNPELHTSLIGLKTLVKEYYNSEIVPVLFYYKFLI